jgi:chloramphenicol-sensitive protein RarD
MDTRRGALYAAGAYLVWGLLPIYWKALQHVPALTLLAQRVIWALGIMLVLLAAQRRGGAFLKVLREPRTLLLFSASGLLLAVNWLVYILAVQANMVVESSLGYFINPLVNVLLGVLFLRERLRIGQMLAIGLAAIAVLYLTFNHGSLPWIALTLAFTFGAYGLLRKTATLGSLDGLTLETLLMFVPALVFLIVLQVSGAGAFGPGDPLTVGLLVISGALTCVPLGLFAAGARRVSMVTLGLLQYMAPTIQFLLGIFLYHEQVSPERLFGFGLIWVALAIYTLESGLNSRRAVAVATAQ